MKNRKLIFSEKDLDEFIEKVSSINIDEVVMRLIRKV